jgi:hypothetical protein
MNRAETHALLTLHIASIDNRRIADDAVLAWQRILADLPFADCCDAVIAHFQAQPDVWLMPGHIRRIVADRDHDRKRTIRLAAERRAVEAEQADPTRRRRSEDVSDIIGRMRQLLPDGHPEKLHRPEWVELERNRARAAWAAAEPNPHYDRHIAYGGEPS